MDTKHPRRPALPARPDSRRRRPPAPSRLDAHLGFWLRFVSNHVSARFARLLDAQGVSVTEWVALRTLFDRPATSHAELIAALGMTKGAASKVIGRLASKGLATREPPAGGGREQGVALTDAGRRVVPGLALLADQNDEHFFGHLDGPQRDTLRALCEALVRHHRLTEVPIA